MKNIVLSIVLSTLAIFILKAVSWMVLPFHGEMLQPISEHYIQGVNKENEFIASGLYHYPDIKDPKLAKKIAKGPRIPLMVVVKEGSSIFNPLDFIKSLITDLITVLLVFIFIKNIKDKSLKNVMKVSFLLALLVTFVSDLPITIWYKFPLKFAVLNTLDHVIGICISGFIISKLTFKNSTI